MPQQRLKQIILNYSERSWISLDYNYPLILGFLKDIQTQTCKQTKIEKYIIENENEVCIKAKEKATNKKQSTALGFNKTSNEHRHPTHGGVFQFSPIQ